MEITVFTDPTCPWAYSAEPTRLKLKWLYGSQLNWQNKMIVLSGFDDETSSITPDYVHRSRLQMRVKYGMPMSDKILPKIPATILACQSYVAVELNQPEKADGFLRQLRIASMNQELVDEIGIIKQIANQATVAENELENWLESEQVKNKLILDAQEARNPGNKALNMNYKLSKTSKGVVRYSASSYIFLIDNKIVFELPGFWPVETYEAVIGNFLPNATRKRLAKTSREILEWAPYPLATKEIAVICNKTIGEVMQELKGNATFEPFGQDGFWSLTK